MEQIHQTERAAIWRTVVGPLDNNVYLVQCRSSKSAALIDAADEPQRLTAAVSRFGPTVILTTHGHADHVGAVGDLRSDQLRFALHPSDGFLVPHTIDIALTASTVDVGELAIEIIHTPGHTPGSVCFLVDGVLMTGDTLFPGGPGATRFGYSDFDQIIESIETKLFTMPDATVFYPGHGAASSIGAESPSLAEWKKRRW